MDSVADNRDRQAAELTLLTTMYPSEFSWRTNLPPDLSRSDFPDPHFALVVHPSYTIEITLPESYPATAKPHVYLSCGGDVPTSTRKDLRATLTQIVETQEEDLEILDLIINAFLDVLPSFLNTASSNKDESQTQESDTFTVNPQASRRTNANTDDRKSIKRVVIWSHHLLATSKRRAIRSWSLELSLTGYSRPGHPGAVFAQGSVDDIDEFVRRLKGLRWQALQVRAEDVLQRNEHSEDGEEGADAGGGGIVEVEGLGEIAEGLRASRGAECADLFLQGMKISSGAAT